VGNVRVARALAWPVLLLAGASCVTVKSQTVDFSSAPREYRGKDYPEVYERWTRHDKVVHEVDSAIEVWVTYKSIDFREAFVARYAEAYALADEDRERLRRSQRDAAASDYEFLIQSQSANYRWNDLEKKSSPWRVSLLDGRGGEVVPDSIKVEKLPDMFEREFFPAKTPFTKTYLVRFSRGAAGAHDGDFAGEKTGVIKLRFAGPMGHADLSWIGR
jgi:hypothetical protein